MKYLVTVNNCIRKFRKELGISQNELSESTGISQNTISDLETHKRGCTLETAFIISDRLGRHIDEVFWWTETCVPDDFRR